MSWILKKIIKSKELLAVVGTWAAVMHNEKFSLRKVYNMLQGPIQKVDWRRLIYNNKANPKSKFVLWLTIHNRLAIVNRIINAMLTVI